MFVFFLLLLVAGLMFLALSNKIFRDVEKLDAAYSGEIIPDEEEELIYHFQRKAKIRNAKGAKNLAYILLFWALVWGLIMITEVLGLI